VESPEILARAWCLENLVFPAALRTESGLQVLLAMQKVVGSNPISRLVVWLVNPFAFDLAVLGRSGWLVRGAGGAGG
jgi:hypothetical protein